MIGIKSLARFQISPFRRNPFSPLRFFGQSPRPLKQEYNLPLIDLESYYAAKENKVAKYNFEVIERQIASQIGQACRNVGFLLLKNHRISQYVFSQALRMNYEFFCTLSEQQKQEVSKDKIKGLPYGYSKKTKIQQTQIDHSPDRFTQNEQKEVMDALQLFKVCLGPKNIDQRNPLMKDPLWPKKPKQFKESLTTFHHSCQALSRDLLSLMAVQLNLPRDYFNPMLVGHMSVSSLVNYPPIPPEKSEQHKIRLGAHTDFGVLTILKDDGIQGLQIQMDPNNSIEWTPVSIPKDCVCINIGDEMEILTNYLWRSTMHRVVNGEGVSEPRKSIVYFQSFHPRTVIKALPTCVSADRPDSGVEFISEEYLEKRLKSIY